MPYTSNKLRALRDLFGYSQSAVAFQMSVAQSTYCRYEGGTSKPDADELETVAHFYGFTFAEFMAHDSRQLVQMAVTRDAFIKSRIRGGVLT